MTILKGFLKDVAGQAFQAQGTAVVLQSRIIRPAENGGGVILRELYRIPMYGTGGKFTTPELDPGPVRVEISGGVSHGEHWDIDLPASGTHDLADLIGSTVEWSPVVVARAEAAARAAESARTGAVNASKDATDAAAQATSAAARAAEDILTQAQQTVSWSADKLTYLGKTSPSLKGDKGDTGAPGPANTLSVGTVSSGAAPSAVITGTAPNQMLDLVLPAGPTGAAAKLTLGKVETLAPGSSATASVTGTAPDYVLNLGLPAGASGSSTWENVTGKPSVFPPAGHSHSIGDLTDMSATGRGVATATSAQAARDAIGAGTSNLTLGTTSSTAARGDHTHTTAQITGLDSALATQRAQINARPALFSGTGTPPATIPGAVVGDWWLNTTTMELSKITGV